MQCLEQSQDASNKKMQSDMEQGCCKRGSGGPKESFEEANFECFQFFVVGQRDRQTDGLADALRSKHGSRAIGNSDCKTRHVTIHCNVQLAGIAMCNQIVPRSVIIEFFVACSKQKRLLESSKLLIFFL